jgi:hypothetical protein
MLDPVSGSIFGKGNVFGVRGRNVIVQTEENAKGGLGKECVGGLGKNMIP